LGQRTIDTGALTANRDERSRARLDPAGEEGERSRQAAADRAASAETVAARRSGDSTMVRKSLLAASLLGVLALLQALPLAAQQVGQVTVTSTTASMVWQYSPACAANDYSDVPVRPFLVGPGGQTVLWFAANANGSYASVGTGTGPDILANFQRGTAAGPGCVSWLPPASYPGSTPASYNTGLWLVAPFTPDGTNIEALVHNEFHGEWTNSFAWCWAQTPDSIYLPCDYWNIVSASSSDAGRSFQLLQQPTSNANMPAIALGLPYVPPPTPPPPPSNLPQGMTAQSNILQFGIYYYVLVQQLSSTQSGICPYRALVRDVGTPLTWVGWGGNGYTVTVPTSYPEGASLPLCVPVPGIDAPFRFSWSYNTVLNQLILIGQDTILAMTGRGISVTGCPIAPNVTNTPDSAFVYMTATIDGMGQLTPGQAETCLLQINSVGNWQSTKSITGQAYPSLLDPRSPQIVPGEINFQFSGSQPWLYFTQLNPYSNTNRNGYDRDVVRLPLSVTVSTGTTGR
jgi:hypothetical protein